MTIRRFLLTLCVGELVSAGGLHAEQPTQGLIPGELSATVAFLSDYRFRGISETRRRPAGQVSLDWEMPLTNGTLRDLNVFLGVFASNVDFGKLGAETEFYGGLNGTYDKFEWELQLSYSKYFHSGVKSGSAYFEINPLLTREFGPAKLTVGVAYSPDFFAGSGSAVYLYGEAGILLPIAQLKSIKPTLELAVGQQWISRNSKIGIPDYLNWSIGASVEIEGFKVSVAYVDTNIKTARCFDGDNVCSATGMLRISRRF